MLSNDPHQKGLLIGIFILLSLILLGGTFVAGVRVGKHLSYARSAKAFRDVGFPPEMVPYHRGRGRGGFNRHGLAGEVIAIGDDNFTILTNENEEKTLLIGSEMDVFHRRERKALSDVEVGSNVIGIGVPDSEGNIRLKRLMLDPWME